MTAGGAAGDGVAAGAVGGGTTTGVVSTCGVAAGAGAVDVGVALRGSRRAEPGITVVGARGTRDSPTPGGAGDGAEGGPGAGSAVDVAAGTCGGDSGGIAGG